LNGTSDAGKNFGTVLTWFVWWPALGIIFLLAGRIWCTACPFSLISDWVQKAVGNNLPVPKLLKRQGPWLIIALFILLTWCEDFFDIVHSTLATGVLLLVIITGVVASGAFFERRTWCRYLCPLGGMAGIYSRVGILQLRGARDKCMKCNSVDCYKGGSAGPGCSMFEFPRILDSSANCNFCGACVKNCPNESVVVSVRAPSSELWSVNKPKVEESSLAAIMAGLLIALNTLEVAEDRLPAFLGGGNVEIGFTIFFIISLCAPVILLLAAARLASSHNGTLTRTNFARFGYALIPVVLTAHIGHTGSEFLEKGMLIPFSIKSLLNSSAPIPESAALLGEGGIMAVHLLLYGAGVLLSCYTAWRIARASYKPEKRLWSMLPFVALVMIFAGLNILLILSAE
jgi:polyferredoxin